MPVVRKLVRIVFALALATTGCPVLVAMTLGLVAGGIGALLVGIQLPGSTAAGGERSHLSGIAFKYMRSARSPAAG